MEDQINQTPIAEPTPLQPTVSEETSYHRKKRAVKGIAIAVLVIIVAAIVWLVVRHRNTVPASPAETLQELENTSAPVTAPIDQRAAELQDARQTSAPVTATEDDRIKMLNALQ